MTREAIWQAYLARNPQFETGPRITFTPAGLRKFFDETWRHAEAEGQRTAPTPPPRIPSKAESLFKGFFS